MNVLDGIKCVLRAMPITNRLGIRYRAWQEARKIESEQLYYERKAKELGVSKTYSVEEVRQELHERLSKRNAHVRPNDKGKLHVVYASRPVPWDAQNIVPALSKFADVATYFYAEHGFDYYKHDWVTAREKMNVHFVDFIAKLRKKKSVDLVLTYFSGKEISSAAIEAINRMGIVTSAFHLDDRLSFRGRYEGGRWAGPAAVCKAYDLNLTQAPESLVKYTVEGGIVMLWPLAANQNWFYPREVPFKYDVSFVGSAHGNRRPFIGYLRRKGVSVEAFGAGWPNGFIPDEKVPEIFSSSRINLNFGDISHTNYQCGKCRDFEIPMSGGLMLTTHNEHLKRYFAVGEEIFTFRSKEECLEKIFFLLGNDKLCERARAMARRRAVGEHTWENRVRTLLGIMGYL